MAEVHGIVIVGGGIFSLATALALHRKGISSLVLEKSETLRADGVAIGVHANGWQALEQLGVATELRETSTLITAYHSVWHLKATVLPARKELRFLRRQDLVETLAKNLPQGTIRFGCHITTVHDDASYGAVLTTVDGSTIKAKVLIGCDGANSVVANQYLALGDPSQLARLIILGFTSYPHGHPFGNEFLRLGRSQDFAVGRIPVTDNLVHFFMTRSSPSTHLDASAAKEYVLEKLQDQECPAEIAEMVRRCDPESLKVLTKVWYRSPWRVMLGGFQRGTAMIAGDAMHVMGPFIGQGGSAALEDAVVLARSLSPAVPPSDDGGVDSVSTGDHQQQLRDEIGAAIGKYVRERRARVVMLSLESFVMGVLLREKSVLKKLICMAILALLGSESCRHGNYH